MITPSAVSFRTALARPAIRASLQPTARSNVVARRWNSDEARGGRSKLIFRFGLKDIPVELYPLGFVVGVALTGGLFASARHFYLDGLRLGPTRGNTETH